MKEIFTSDFWVEVYGKIANWVITELPGLIFVTIFVFILFRVARMILSRIRKRLVKRAEKGENPAESEKRINTLIGIVQAVVRIVIWATYLMILLRKFGIDIAPIIASAGIIGLAVGFGAQELVRDFISGFFILLENQIRVGDVAVIDGTGGLVEKIELRTTTLRDFEGVVHVFQNGKINSLSNRTKEWSAVVLDIGVAYKEDTNQVIDVIKKVGEELKTDPDWSPRILEPIEVFGLDQFGDSAVVIKARIKTIPIEQWNVGREYRKRLKYAFDAQNIEIPFPHTTIYWGEKIKPLHIKN
ncbi:MAG: mechanosensitive ion channel family protein [Prolixibacteraceae bacterium]|nr:mechanosensitive ion channel family protein [Prolixibacteraceae bacterium]MBN2774988.1 mechanosensitive ion channel family protein [Prolixibacteraceae bacterium]